MYRLLQRKHCLARFNEIPLPLSFFAHDFKAANQSNLVTYNEEESFLYLACKIELSPIRLASSIPQIPTPTIPWSSWKHFIWTTGRLSSTIQLLAEVKDSLMKRIGYSLEKIILALKTFLRSHVMARRRSGNFCSMLLIGDIRKP